MDRAKLVETAIGPAARYDYDPTDASSGSSFHIVEPERQVTLSCQDQAIAAATHRSASRTRWQAIAESSQPLP